VQFVHNPGWLLAAPSNAEDAVGLLAPRCAATTRPCSWSIARCSTKLGAAALARRRLRPPLRPRPQDTAGRQISIITWGAMVPRCEEALGDTSGDVIDLRTLVPWDREMVLESVRRTRRCLIVHEDLRSGGFGAEIAAVVADEAFLDLDAPVARVTMPDIPSPHNPALLDWAVPSVADIRAKIEELVGF
jgi:2-oxoisovalerate dehydrogenase E1 component